MSNILISTTRSTSICSEASRMLLPGMEENEILKICEGEVRKVYIHQQGVVVLSTSGCDRVLRQGQENLEMEELLWAGMCKWILEKGVKSGVRSGECVFCLILCV